MLIYYRKYFLYADLLLKIVFVCWCKLKRLFVCRCELKILFVCWCKLKYFFVCWCKLIAVICFLSIVICFLPIVICNHIPTSRPPPMIDYLEDDEIQQASFHILFRGSFSIHSIFLPRLLGVWWNTTSFIPSFISWVFFYSLHIPAKIVGSMMKYNKPHFIFYFLGFFFSLHIYAMKQAQRTFTGEDCMSENLNILHRALPNTRKKWPHIVVNSFMFSL